MNRYFEHEYRNGAAVANDLFIDGTDDTICVNNEKLNDWHVKRNGKRDDMLTKLMLRAAGERNLTSLQCVKDIAHAIRAQYESEKPKRFEFTASNIDLYRLAYYCNPPEFIGEPEIRKIFIANHGPLASGIRLKITIEEI